MSMRIGIAGYGRRGRWHVNAINCIAGAELTSVADPIEASRAAALSDIDGVSIHQSVAEMVDAGNVDAVIVAAPAHLNSDVAIQAIRQGIPALVEKPPALSVKRVLEMQELAEKTGSKVMVAFNRRFNPLIRSGIEIIADSGPVRQIVAEFHKDIHEFTDDPRISPEMMDLMLLESPIHSVDLVTHMAASPVAHVSAVVKRTTSGYRDVHAALIEFDNEIVCQFTAAYTSGGRLERYELHGDYVSVYLEGVQRGWVLRDGERTEIELPEDAENDTFLQAHHFVTSITDDMDFPPPAATLETSIETLRLCESILDTVDSS